MRTAADYLLYLLLRFGWAVARAIPLRFLRAFLEGFAALIGRLDRQRRNIVLGNLRIAFPQWSSEQAESIADRAFRNWGRIIAEVAHADRFLDGAGEWVARAEAQVARAQAAGTGMLVLTAHTGNFELMARLWGRCSGRKIWVFHRPLSNRYIDAFLVDERASSGVGSLGRGVGLRAAMRVLAGGGIVAVPLDQNQPPGRPGVFTDMFGRPAATATVLARLSLSSGAPVVPVFSAWDDGVPTASVGEAIVPSGVEAAGQERSARIRALTSAYTAAIEAAVRRHPDQWNWAHRRWKTQPDKIRSRASSV